MAVIRNYVNQNQAVARPRVVDKAKSQSKAKSRTGTLTFSIAIGLIILLLTIQSTQIFLVKNNIFQLERQILVAQENLNSATLEVTRLKSPDRILAMAQDLCNLTLPKEGQFVAVHPSKR